MSTHNDPFEGGTFGAFPDTANKTSATGGALIDLLPCPFCASNDLAVHEHCTGNSYMVLCHNCTGEGPLHETKQLAAEFWNRRAALARAGQQAGDVKPWRERMGLYTSMDLAISAITEAADGEVADLRAHLASNREAYNAMVLLANQTNMRRDARIKELEAQLASAQIDAARYQYLRDPANSEGVSYVAASSGDDLDAAIDAARAQITNKN